MNLFVILISSLLAVPISEKVDTNFNQAINHVVTYVSYTNTNMVVEDEAKPCRTSFYLFSNHSERIIKVKFKEIVNGAEDVRTSTLYPSYSEKQDNGDLRTITRPEKIDGDCEASFEVVEAWFVEKTEI